MALRSFGKLARLANLQVTIDPLGKSAYVYIPALSLDDIDRTGHINALRILKLMTTARYAACQVPHKETGCTFLEYNKFADDYFPFMAGSQTRISRACYGLIDSQSWSGLEASVRLGHLGSSSVSTLVVLSEPSTGQELARTTHTDVCVDFTTRRPCPLPDWMTTRYADAVVDNKKISMTRQNVPAETSRHQVTVQWSDIDPFKHASFLSYFRFCEEAATEGVQKGDYRQFHGDILDYRTSGFESMYLKECRAGDQLDVASWEDDRVPRRLHFHITRDDVDIFQCYFDYHNSQS